MIRNTVLISILAMLIGCSHRSRFEVVEIGTPCDDAVDILEYQGYRTTGTDKDQRVLVYEYSDKTYVISLSDNTNKTITAIRTKKFGDEEWTSLVRMFFVNDE
jgi:hypothetical protein